MQSEPVKRARYIPPEQAGTSERQSSFWGRYRTLILLVGILAVGAYFRFNGQEFDQGTSQHPDERNVVQHTLPLKWPAPGQNLFDARTSPMNIRALGMDNACTETGCEYAYGSLPVYLVKGAGWVLDSLGFPSAERKGYYLNDYYGVIVLGRHLSAIFDLITVLLVFLIARRLYSSSAGLIAAALVAFSVTHIQLAHFTTVDSFLTTFMVAALYYSVVLMQRPTWWAALGAGASIGLAVGTKVSVVPFALIIVAAVGLRSVYRKQTRKLGAEFGAPIGLKPASATERNKSFWGHLRRGLVYLPIAGVASILAFAIAEPYVFWQFNFSRGSLAGILDSNPWWTRIVAESRIQIGRENDTVYTRQYVGTVPILYHLQNMVFWGLSPIPGFLTLVGFVAAIWRAIWRKPAEILLMAGALPYFASLLTLEAKWMRYMLPLVPVFCILGAAFLVRGHIWVRGRVGQGRRTKDEGRSLILPRLQRSIFPVLTGVVILAAFLWAVAFSNIYSQKHSRVQASEWILDNVPEGITKTSEGWDDGLPLGVRSRPGRAYTDVQLDIYGDPPPEQKFEYFKTQIANVDYIFIASNRLYGSVARMPWRYPVHIQFYDLLYAEKLGFQRVHTSHVTPEIFGVRFDDQSADESFTVYDHPRVDVFQKTNNLTDDQLRTLFAPALDRPAGDFQSVRHGKVTNDKPLTYKEPIATLPDVGDYAWNPLAQEDTQWIAVVLWLLAAQLLGFLALPIIFTVCRNLPDRGYAFAKLLGLLLVSWGAWMAASARMIPFTVWSVMLMALVMSLLSALCWRLGAGRQIREFFRHKRTLVIFYETLFFAAFALFLFIRVLNPDLWHPTNGGEKPMEIGFLNSVLRSPWMPPLDPFFAGGYINYYYHGYVIVGTLVKLVGVDPAIAINLAIPLLYALTFTAAASVVYNIVAWSQRRRRIEESGLRSQELGTLTPDSSILTPDRVSRAGMGFGALAGVLMLLIGNMNGLWQFIMVNFPQLRDGMATWARGAGFSLDSMVRPYADYNFWDPSRIIASGNINEFPFWSFLFADLHPHVIDMPFTIFTAGLALNLAFSGMIRRTVLSHIPNIEANQFRQAGAYAKGALRWLWGDGWSGVLRFAVMALALGVLAVTNSWDFPTYAGLTFGGVLVALFCSKPTPDASSAAIQAVGVAPPAATEQQPTRTDIWTTVITSVISVGALAGIALLAYIPFFLGFKAFYTQILWNVEGGILAGSNGGLMRRTTLGEFMVVWLIFLFIAASYLVYRLLRFPWSQALDGLANIAGVRPTARSTPALPQQAFRRMGSGATGSPSRLFGRAPTLAMATAAPPGSGEQRVPTSYAFGAGVGERDPEAEPAAQKGRAGAGEAAENGQQLLGLQGVDGAEGLVVERPSVHVADLNGDGVRVEEGANGVESQAPTGPWMSHNANGNMGIEIMGDETTPAPMPNWTSGTHSQPSVQAAVALPKPMEGAIPAWAGLLLLFATGALVVLQVVTRQYVLALLIMLLGGIIASTLAGRRSVPSYFTSLLLVIGLVVAMGVELVYLADHLQGDPNYYRMNTVFKFYIQVWVLLAMGGAAAIYFIIFGLQESRRAKSVVAGAAPQSVEAAQQVGLLRAEQGQAGIIATDTPFDAPTQPLDARLMEQPLHQTTTTDNWLVWAGTGPLDSEQVKEDAPPDVQPANVPIAVQPVATEERVERYKPRLTVGRLVWLGAFALLLLSCLVYPIVETPVRVKDRFGVAPPIGTLNGLKYMTVATLQNNNVAPFPMQLRYDYDAIRWMNQNIKGNHVIAERPIGYYREFGMRVASNTGFPMVVGAQHQDEQRYGWQVGPRSGDMDELFKTEDVQRALIMITKYDIDYVYLGQIEQGYAGAGLAKFKQMADPKVGILREVFRVPEDREIPGTTIYQVIRDAKTITGSPVEGSGIPGISMTPIPTAIPTPAPTPPTDDPTLKSLLDDSRANPQDMEKRGRLVEWYRNNGYHEYAARELEAMTKFDPSGVALRHQWGDELQAAGKPEEALKAWISAVEVAPNDPAAHNKLGIAYLDRRKYEEAKTEFEATVGLDAAWTEGWFHLGETYERLGKSDDARNAYQSAINNAKNADTDGWVNSARRRLDEIR